MKKALSILFSLLIYSSVDAQKVSWNKFSEVVYGSEKEYNQQLALREDKGYELYQLIGFKSFYTNGPSAYLQQHGFSMDARESGNKMIYSLTSIKNKSESVKLVFWLDTNDRVIKAKFTGEKTLLTYMFQTYWPKSPEEEDLFEKGAILEKHLNGDRIVFNYKGSKPYIEIRN